MVGDEEMKELGVVVSPTGIDEFSFLLKEPGALRKGSYCIINHPVTNDLVLCRVYDGEIVNPDMLPLAFGPILARAGVKLGREQEVILLKAESLGYITTEELTSEGVKKELRMLKKPDYPPYPGQSVFEADPETIKGFMLGAEEGAITVNVGVDPYSNVELALSVDLLTKGHLAVFGMTRSGKTTFMLRLISNGSRQGARFLIFDRTGEYVEPLTNLSKISDVKVNVIDPYDLKGLSYMDEGMIASYLKLDARRRAGKVIAERLFELIKKGEIEQIKNIEWLKDVCAKGLRKDIANEVISIIDHRSFLLTKLILMRLEPVDIIGHIKDHHVNIVDLSKEASIEDQQIIVRMVLDELFRYAILTHGEDITCMVVLEEAQFYAPERSVVSYGDPEDTGSLRAITACLSQLGGYNVGFVIMSQRPAYVSKAVVSQCNTVLSFRLMSKADHDQVAAATGYPVQRVSALLSGLSDHIGYMIGMASPFGFPTFVRTTIELYPRKAVKRPSEVIKGMQGRVSRK